MAVTHVDLISRADELLKQVGTEVVVREATRVAYYSAFHYARELAKNLPDPTFKDGHRPRSHEFVIETFVQVEKNHRYKHIARECTAIAQALLKAGSRRNIADYELNRNLTPGVARQQNVAVKQVRSEMERVANKLTQKATSA